MAFDAFALIVAMLALGMLLGRTGTLDATGADALNRVVLYICLPAAVLRYAPQLTLEPTLLGVVAVPWLLLVPIVPLIVWLGGRMAWRRDQTAALLVLVLLGNTSFIGYPLIRALLGDGALPYAVVYDQFGSFLIISSYGLYVLARYSGEHRPSPGEIARRVLRFPPFIALLLAFSVMPAEPPEFIANGLQKLADALPLLAMLAIGVTLRLRLPTSERQPLAIGLVLKLAIMPGLAWLLAIALGLPELMLRAAVLESAMPPMVTAAALVIAHRLAPALASAMIGYGIAAALLTVPAWAWLLARHPVSG
ncbi:MAG TPA: malate permease [Xanthomonadales bacterium]|nr:malate permease [Xanthomonadales bacterium]